MVVGCCCWGDGWVFLVRSSDFSVLGSFRGIVWLLLVIVGWGFGCDIFFFIYLLEAIFYWLS